MSDSNKTQVGGSHYKQSDGGEEHWDRVHRLNLDYFQGQITKYVERYKKKNGIQDLEKARHFIDKLIELEKAKAANAPQEERRDRAAEREVLASDLRARCRECEEIFIPLHHSDIYCVKCQLTPVTHREHNGKS